MDPIYLKRVIIRLIVLLFCNWSLHAIAYKLNLHLPGQNTSSPIDAKYRQKKRQMARMAWKFFHSTVCMLVFSVVVHATMPSGIHPIIAFLRQLNHVVKSKSLRGWQIYIINSQPFYIEGFMVSSITNLIRTANHSNAMVQTANLTCLASIVMSSMRHGLIASKKAMMGCLPDGMVAR